MSFLDVLATIHENTIQVTEKGVPFVTVFLAQVNRGDELSETDSFIVTYPMPLEAFVDEDEIIIESRADLEEWAERQGYEDWTVVELPLSLVSPDGYPLKPNLK